MVETLTVTSNQRPKTVTSNLKPKLESLGRDEPVSLAPLDPQQVLRALLATPPPETGKGH
jgi:hypothetical protein